MTNLTITLDDAIVKKARVRAIQQGTSLSAKVREFLQQYVNEAEASRQDSSPRVYTQSEMQARLDALRRGEFARRTKPAAASASMAFDRPAALGLLTQAWQRHDAAALRPGGWWRRILEQLRDGLL